MISLKRVESAVLMVALAVTAQALSFSPDASAKGFWDQKKAMECLLPGQKTSLIRLKKTDNLWTVLEDDEVKGLMKNAMGADLEKYFAFTQLTELPDVKGADLYAAAGVRGLFSINETFFDLNMNTKTVCVCVLDNNKLSIYGAESQAKLPEPVKEYIQDLRSRISGPDSLICSSSLPKISFEKAKKNSLPAVAQLARKNLKLSQVTGSYSRVDTDPRFEGADFRVSRLPGNRINFSCQALSGAHCGEASGVVPIENNVAVYKCSNGNEAYKLTMRFDGKYVYVDQDGDGFGGIGVTASGTYEKTDDQNPQFQQN